MTIEPNDIPPIDIAEARPVVAMTSARTDELAWRFARESADFAAFVAALPAAHWQRIVGEGELRSVGMVAYHVAYGYDLHRRYFGAIAAGKPLPPLTTADGDRMSASLAEQGAGMAQGAVLEALQTAAAAAAEWIRGLNDAQLAMRGEYLVGVRALTVAAWIEHGLTGHPPAHMQDIRAALQR
jgi:DinB family protein